MSAPRTLLCLLALTVITCVRASIENAETTQNIEKQVQLLEGVTMEIPVDRNNTKNKLISFEIDTGIGNQGRGKQKNLMQRILPMFIMPFLIQSTIVPMFLSMLKFMLFKSMMVGKLALALIIFNAFRNHNTYKGRDSQIADVHYGYQGNGMEEYGAYIN